MLLMTLITFSLLFLVACSTNKNLDGTYSYEKDGATITITIDDEDGTISVDAGDDSNTFFGDDNISLDFTVDKEEKTFDLYGTEIHYSLSGDILTISIDEEGFRT